MEVIIQPDPESVAEAAFEILRADLERKPNLILGLGTGKTPLGLYKKMQESKLDFRQVRFFNLDEFVGLSPDDPRSFSRFLHENLFRNLRVEESNLHLMRADMEDLEEAAEEYERKITMLGGIDLQLLGLGRNGHIAFNEPGSSLGSRTRPKALAVRTMVDYAGTFDTPDDVPRFSLTMGIGTILEARRLIILATGESKAEPVRLMAEGPITAEVPGSAVQLHARAHLVVDEAAASELERADYWKWSYQNKWRVGQ